MKNFKNLAIVLLLVCVIACTLTGVSAADKDLEKKDTPLDLDDAVIPLDLSFPLSTSTGSITLPQGVYIVKADNKPVKLIVKSVDDNPDPIKEWEKINVEDKVKPC